MRTKTLILVALLAFAAGGTCPSDVNNDGTVGINDFLQVLSDWGPCPSARLVAMANIAQSFSLDGDNSLAVRIWSDNTLQIGMDILGFDTDWGCAESFPRAGTWETVEPPPIPGPSAQPVDVGGVAQFGTRRVFVAYSDGTVYTRFWNLLFLAPCTDNPCCSNHREFVWVGEWTPFTGVLR